MSFSYSGNPGNSSLDGVRFLVQDTNAQDAQLQDAEILWLISQYTNIWRSAAYAAQSIANKYARQVSKAVGDLRLEYQQRQTSYTAMKEDYLRQAANRTALPYLGGISRNEHLQDRLNPDLVQPTFTKKQFHYPEGMTGPNSGITDIGPSDETD